MCKISLVFKYTRVGICNILRHIGWLVLETLLFLIIITQFLRGADMGESRFVEIWQVWGYAK